MYCLISVGFLPHDDMFLNVIATVYFNTMTVLNLEYNGSLLYVDVLTSAVLGFLVFYDCFY